MIDFFILWKNQPRRKVDVYDLCLSSNINFKECNDIDNVYCNYL